MQDDVGRRLAHARLFIDEIRSQQRTDLNTWRSYCDANGAALVPQPTRPDGYSLCVLAGGRYYPRLFHYQVRGGAQEVTVTVPRGGQVGIRIDFPGGQEGQRLWFWTKPAEAPATAVIQRPLGEWRSEAPFNSIGWFAPGEYDVAFGGPGVAQTPTRRVTVAPGSVVDGGIVRLKPAGVEVRVGIRFPRPLEEESCNLRLDRLDVTGFERWGWTSLEAVPPGPEPVFSVPGVPPGRYLVRVAFRRHASAESEPFDVTSEGGLAWVAPCVSVGAARVTVHDGEGRPRPGVLVRVAQGIATWRGGLGEYRGNEHCPPAVSNDAGVVALADLVPGTWELQLAETRFGRPPEWRAAGSINVVADVCTSHVITWPE